MCWCWFCVRGGARIDGAPLIEWHNNEINSPLISIRHFIVFVTFSFTRSPCVRASVHSPLPLKSQTHSTDWLMCVTALCSQHVIHTPDQIQSELRRLFIYSFTFLFAVISLCAHVRNDWCHLHSTSFDLLLLFFFFLSLIHTLSTRNLDWRFIDSKLKSENDMGKFIRTPTLVCAFVCVHVWTCGSILNTPAKSSCLQ